MKTAPSSSCRLVRFISVASACLLFLAAGARGQYFFDKWDTNNGLPQNTVGAIAQTRDGYLWLATLDGLVRFDGVRFRTFTVGNSEGLSSNRFRLLHETRDGALWIGSEDSGVTRYLNGKFRTFGEQDGLPTNSPLIFADDTDGALLVHTVRGIVKFENETFRRVPFDFPVSVNSCPARGGGVWIFDPKNIWRVGNGAVEKFEIESAPAETDYNPVCFEAADGSLWIARRYGQVFSFKSGKIAIYNAENGLPAKVSVYFINQDGANLWFGTSGGLLKFDGSRFESYDAEDGLSDKFLISFFKDRENSLWFGTSLGGLNRLNRRMISVLTTADGLAGNSVYPIYEAKDGAVWVGANGVTRIKDKEFTRFTTEKDGVFSDITAIAEDREGNLWLGTSGGIGVLRDGKFTVLNNKFVMRAGTYNVWAIHEARADGALWIATSAGLVKKTGDNYTVLRASDGLAGDDVKVIHEDRTGRLWFGTYGGLSLLENGKFTNYTVDQGLSSNRVRAIYEDERGTLWIGTYDGGLNRLRDGKFTNYSTRNGLYSDGVFRILADDEGFFWMSSNQGIYRVAISELEDLAAGKIQAVTSEAFGRRDGLLNTECNGGRQPAGVRTRDGRLWFPTQNGAAIVDPQTVAKNPLPPPVVIESVTVDQKTVGLTENIEIQPAQVNLEIAYTGLSFIKPEQVRFRYKLDGLDPDWIEAGTRRTAYYSYLPPNEYTFRVIAANNSGVWNSEGASLRLTVHPPVWRTWWFLTIAVLSVAALIYFVLRRRFAQIERERLAQTHFAQNLIAAQELERKRIAGEIHDGLGQNLLVIKNWALLALQKNERTDAALLEEISETASQTIDEVRRIAYNLRPYQIDEIGLTRATEGMLKRLTAAGKMRLEMQIDNIDDCFAPENEINLFRIVQECMNNIIKHSDAREAKVSITRAPGAVQIKIEDNGKGFSIEDLNGKRGLGLTGIEERARMSGGAAAIYSAPGRGTTIQININL
jgi:signal transduction histidine kinase/ligand-binding sensor domain-containing protein